MKSSTLNIETNEESNFNLNLDNTLNDKYTTKTNETDNPTKKKSDEENHELIFNNSAINNNNLSSNYNYFQNLSNPMLSQNILAKCFNNNNYCLSLMDYFKKLYYFSHIDFYSSYMQLIYCFKPKEISDIARIRKRKHLLNLNKLCRFKGSMG